MSSMRGVFLEFASSGCSLRPSRYAAARQPLAAAAAAAAATAAAAKITAATATTATADAAKITAAAATVTRAIRSEAAPTTATATSRGLLGQQQHLLQQQQQHLLQQQQHLLQQQRGMKFVHPRNWILQWKLRPGDKVVVITGKWKGYIGQILQTDKMRNGVAVEGVKQRWLTNSEGKKEKVEGLIHVSNVMFIDPLLQRPTRLALRTDAKGMPVRVSRRSGLVIPWPDSSLICRDNSRGSVEYLRSKQQQQQQQQQYPIQDMDSAPTGPKDTPKEIALQKTYDYAKEVATMDAIRFMMTKYNRDVQ